MKTDSTSWSRLSAEIDQYRRRAKINLQKYEKKRFNSMYKKKEQKSQDDLMFQEVSKLGYSMNLVREKQHEELTKASRLVNQVNYLKVQRDRKIHSSERVKNKLQRVLSIRSTSSQDRQMIENEINEFKIKSNQRKRLINEKIKSEKAKIEQQRRKILSQNSLKARQVRNSSVMNEQTIEKQKKDQITKKMKIIQKVQNQFESCLQKKQQREKSIVEEGKINHSNKLKQQYLKLARTKRVNEQILNYYINQGQRIMEQTEQAHNNLLNFETALMMRRGSMKNSTSVKNSLNPNTKDSRTDQTKSARRVNNFFHLTN